MTAPYFTLPQENLMLSYILDFNIQKRLLTEEIRYSFEIYYILLHEPLIPLISVFYEN